MDSEKTQVLEELRTATRILVREGVLDGFGHVSVRSPIEPGKYFMLRSNSGEAVEHDRYVELTLDSEPVRQGGPSPSIERFIHGEIYRARPDVKAVVHTHSPALIPFGVGKTPLRPLYHMSAFLAPAVPVFDIRLDHGMTNMLITSPALGSSLADALGTAAMVLMRGHGATLVGSSLQEAVFRATYATINAQLQPIAMLLGDPTYLAPEEATQADSLHRRVLNRSWEFWKGKLGDA
ncbi:MULTISPECIES: class II aldolase/adducin family protein [Sorangium]|uniref:class II aldolase/adducin family protein n=1 Tax=Sorangium TaxID=39643 RepID=UPI003D9C20B8